MYKIFLSVRYLIARKINLVSVVGVCLGVMAMIVILSVMEGFGVELRERIRGTLSHVIVRFESDIEDYPEVLRKVRGVEHVVAAAPYVETLVLLQACDVSTWAFIRGVDPEAEATIGEFRDYARGDGYPVFVRKIREWDRFVEKHKAERRAAGVEDPVPTSHATPGKEESGTEGKTGEAANSGEEDADAGAEDGREAGEPAASGEDSAGADAADDDIYVSPPALLGVELLSSLPKDAGIQLIAPSGFLDVRPMHFENVGRFKTGNYEHDSRAVYVPLKAAQVLAGLPDGITGISVRLDDYRRAEQVVQNLQTLLGDGYTVETWEKQRENLLRAIDNERRVMAVVLLFITIVAGFCIMATLWMMVVEKTRDIGIIKAIGGTFGGVLAIFILNGTLIGVVGAALGVGAGLGFLEIMNPLSDWVYVEYGWHVFPRDIYYLDHIPACRDPHAIALIALSAVIISFLAAVYPAIKAARLDPIQSLRYE